MLFSISLHEDCTDTQKRQHSTSFGTTLDSPLEDCNLPSLDLIDRMSHSMMGDHSRNAEPFIKPEPDDFFDPPRPNHTSGSYGPWQDSSVNALDIGVSPSAMSQQQYSTGQSMPANYASGNSAFTDDDLIASFNLNQPANQHAQHMHNQANNMSNFSNGFQQSVQPHNPQAGRVNGYSSTPDGAPIQSPFTQGNFDFGQWQTVHQPVQQPNTIVSSVPAHTNGLSDAQSPMAAGSHTFSASSRSYQHPPRAHQHSLSGQWDNSPGSGFSLNYDSPMASPSAGLVHPQISEVLKSDTSTSPRLTATRGSGKPATSAEAKKAKRRASHNEVERRRRNHINDRIMELAELVPKHRLDDEAVKRSVSNNVPMPLGVSGSSISPPATSVLAGSHGRRAASIPQGPTDDRDKGPAKGEVLDGAVGWTRDLLWMVNRMLAREKDMQQTIGQLGGPLPPPYNDDEKRMLHEADGAIRHNAIARKQYSRRHGTDLYVPDYTNHAGEPIQRHPESSMSPSSAFDIEPNANSNVNANGNGTGSQFWNYPFKEEDEAPEESFQMEMT